MKETQASIYQWVRGQFGEPKDNWQILGRAEEEFEELREALHMRAIHGGHQEIVVEEIADVVIVLSQIAERLGLGLGEAIDRKMAINRAREWVTNGDGTGQHVEGKPEKPKVVTTVQVGHLPDLNALHCQ